MRRPPLLIPTRARSLEQPFGWLPFRLLPDGHWARLSPAAQQRSAFLALVADPRGVSFYGEARLTALLHRTPAELRAAQRELCAADLLALGRGLFQLLALPAAAGAPRGPEG